jgi:hypothetical protein
MKQTNPDLIIQKSSLGTCLPVFLLLLLLLIVKNQNLVELVKFKDHNQPDSTTYSAHPCFTER